MRRRHVLLLPFLLVALLLAGACASPETRAESLRPLPAAFLQRHAIAYSGYRGADHDTPPAEAQVLEDLELLVHGGWGLIRLFSADEAHEGVVLRLIREHHLDLKVQLGIWISGPKDKADAANQRQIAQGIAMAKAYRDIVLAVSVGNETMVDWSMHIPPADIAAYLHQVRSAIEQPVTTDENWAVFANAEGKYPEVGRVLREMDYVSMHTYPLLDSVYDKAFTAWQHAELPPERREAAMMDSFFDKAQQDYRRVRRALDDAGFARLPVTIGESGWKAFGPQADRIDPEKQRLYAEHLARWRRDPSSPVQVFWFEAFDETWKGDDDGWGLYDVHRQARPAASIPR